MIVGMQQNEAPRVAIIGGGIGGVAAALFLHRAGVPVKVFEQAGAFREVGAGVQVSPNSARLLRRAGLGPALDEIAAVPEVIWQFHRWRTGEVIFEQPLLDHHRDAWGAPYYLVHRARLLDILVSPLPAGMVKLDTRCVGIDQLGSGELRVVAEDMFGRHERQEGAFDCVIVADGMKSSVRRDVFGFDPPTFSGYYAFRADAGVEATPLPRHPQTVAIWLGEDRHFVHYPIDRGDSINLVCAIPVPDWPHEQSWADGTVDEFREAFDGWHPTVCKLISACKGTRKFALYYSDPFDHWTDGRIALLGDAAHPMLSFFAQGSGQAVEDAAILARCLSRVDRDGVEQALALYEAIRRPRASAIQQDANGRRELYHFPDGPLQEARDERLAQADPMRANSWVYEYDADAEFEELTEREGEQVA